MNINIDHARDWPRVDAATFDRIMLTYDFERMAFMGGIVYRAKRTGASLGYQTDPDAAGVVTYILHPHIAEDQ